MSHLRTYPRRCSHYEPGTGERCQETGTHRLTAHGETIRVAGVLCETHARVVVDEYAEKMPALGFGLVPAEPTNETRGARSGAETPR